MVESMRRESLRHYHLGRLWRRRDKPQVAVEHYQQALELDPDAAELREEFASTLVELALAHGRAQRGSEGLAAYERAIALAPVSESTWESIRSVQSDLSRLGLRPTPPEAPPMRADLELPNRPHGKLDLRGQHRMRGHRSGWAHVLSLLKEVHNEQGILFDGIIENTFAWQDEREEKRSTPYQRPWVGVFHNPPGLPRWFMYQTSPQVIMEKEIFRESLPQCRGLFAFSESLARWLRERTGKPVSALMHPTEFPNRGFDFERFRANRNRRIVQIGWWLRRLNAIHQLPIPRENPLGYTKLRLTPMHFPHAKLTFDAFLATEREEEKLRVEPLYDENTEVCSYLADDAYDALLSENLVFVSLYDASVNNTVIECIARGTPLLVNPLPSVVEYLGEDYPMYYEDLVQAASKAQDLSLIEETHAYLTACATRPKLKGDYFLRSFLASEVYASIDGS